MTATVTGQDPPGPPDGGAVRRTAPRAPGALEWALLVVLVLAAAGVRLLWLGAPVDRDEAGYLLLGGQWHPGTSLYGNYWVDRPPLLIGFFALAHVLGGVLAMRIMACVVAGLTVLAAYGVGRAVGERNGSALWPAAAAAAFVSTPLFDVVSLNGELIAVPLVLAGILAAIRGLSATRHRAAWWLAAGVLGAAAALVKQNFVDVFVFVGALAIAGWVARSQVRVLVRDLAALAGAAVATAAVVLAFAAWRGTSPSGLWVALVVFRVRAGRFLSRHVDPGTIVREHHYPVLLLASGALAVLVVLVAVLVSNRRSALAVATACMIAWEFVAIMVSAQFWWHYLIGLVPGLVLTTALAVRGRGLLPVSARAAVVWAVVATMVVVPVNLSSALAPSRNHVTGEWLGRAAQPGDTAVVLFGQPNILLAAKLGSPYPYLWSLPLRIQDPHLNTLVRVLTGPRAPEWVLFDHRQGMSAQRRVRIRPLLSGPYVLQRTVCGYQVYLRAGVHRALPPRPSSC